MPHDYRHSPWATGSIALQYLFLLVAVAALLRFVGLGWVGAVVGGLIVAAALFSSIYVVLRKHR